MQNHRNQQTFLNIVRANFHRMNHQCACANDDHFLKGPNPDLTFILTDQRVLVIRTTSQLLEEVSG